MNKRDKALQLIKELEDNQDRPISPNLKENLENLTLLTEGCSDIVFRQFDFGNGLCGFIVYIEGIVKSEHIQDHALRPFLMHLTDQIDEHEEALQNTLSISSVALETSMSKVAASIIEGNAVLFADGHSKGLILNIKGGQRRSIEEPITESTIRGSREGFTESLRVNTALVRFRVKTFQLKMISFKIGTKTKTDVVLAYIDGLADPKVIDKAKKRIKKIKIDAVLESGYIEEFIEDDTYSPFPQLQYTERPDTVAAQLLEGRFAIFTDNTPFVLTGPITFWQLMQASEDYYERYLMSNLIRWLRYMFLFVALYLPAIYVAVITYHQDLMPTNLMFSVASAREPIPFPAIIEALIMEISFEALREASPGRRLQGIESVRCLKQKATSGRKAPYLIVCQDGLSFSMYPFAILKWTEKRSGMSHFPQSQEKRSRFSVRRARASPRFFSSFRGFISRIQAAFT